MANPGESSALPEPEAVLSQPEPNTQPVEEGNFNLEELSLDTEDDKSWGWLHPIGEIKFESIALSNQSYTFGRLNNCDFKIHNHVTNETLRTISKEQFRIYKKALSSSEGTEIVEIEDLSSNGTFINKTKVGKGNKKTLFSNDKISLANPNTQVYMYVKTSSLKNWVPKEMKPIYTVIGHIGNGAFGEVKLAKIKDTGRSVAIKKIKIKDGKEKRAFNEVKILQDLQHPCIVRMEDVYDTADSLYIVLEYVAGGELASWIRDVKRLSDPEAKSVCYQLARALQYLHNKGVAHRDLKPENVLLSKVGGDHLIKVADFGLSKLVDSKTSLRTQCGTKLYIAPEVLKTQFLGTYTHQVDIWSLGVIMFLCLSGKLPFSKDRSPMPVAEQIIRGMYSQGGPHWRGVSSQAASLVRHMLQTDPFCRYTITQILAHPWIQDKGMQTKVNRLMKRAQVHDENVCPDIDFPEVKRPRLEEDTVVTSCVLRPN